MSKRDLNKARNGLKKCWDVLNSMNEFMVDVCDNPKSWRKLKMSLKDIEYGYEDYIKGGK